MIEVREARATDAEAVGAVCASAIATLRETYRPTQELVEEKASMRAALTRFVALIEEEVVGTLEYRREGDRIHLMGLGVVASFRGRGIATRLVETLTEIGAPFDAKRITLHTIKETGNVAVFERMGFRVLSQRLETECESDRFETLTDVFMERTIDRGFVTVPRNAE